MKKNDVEFIKWLCVKAEGFDIDYFDKQDILCAPDTSWYYFGDLKKNRVRNVYYPLLLQRAIEGVNKEGDVDDSFIMTGGATIQIRDGILVTRTFWIENNIDQAKEAALLYIYEQEKTNET